MQPKLRLIQGVLCYIMLLALPGYGAQQSIHQAKSNLKQLQTKITQLQQGIMQDQNQRSVLNQQLMQTEKEIQQQLHQIQATQQALSQNQLKIQQIEQKISEIDTQLQRQQAQLSRHVQVRYRLGEQQPVKWLFQQNDPRHIERLLTYHQYLIHAQQQDIQQIQTAQKRSQHQHHQLHLENIKLHQLQQQLHAQQQKFERHKYQHAALLQTLNQTIQDKQQTLQHYRQNQINLTRLLTSLAAQSVIQTRHPFTQMRRRLPKPLKVSEIKHSQIINQGTMFYAAEGNSVYTIFPGKVVFSDWLNGYGLLLIIDHGWGFMTLYANNHTLLKQKGDVVNQGEQIATVGHSGGFKQNGLYFEIRHRGRAVPVLEWLS